MRWRSAGTEGAERKGRGEMLRGTQMGLRGCSPLKSHLSQDLMRNQSSSSCGVSMISRHERQCLFSARA